VGGDRSQTDSCLVGIEESKLARGRSGEENEKCDRCVDERDAGRGVSGKGRSCVRIEGLRMQARLTATHLC